MLSREIDTTVLLIIGIAFLFAGHPLVAAALIIISLLYED